MEKNWQLLFVLHDSSPSAPKPFWDMKKWVTVEAWINTIELWINMEMQQNSKYLYFYLLYGYIISFFYTLIKIF